MPDPFALESWAELRERWPMVAKHLTELIDQCRSRALSKGQVSSLEDLAELRGEVEAYETLLTLPDRIIEKLEKERKGRNARV
jgi:hypothetical protein